MKTMLEAIQNRRSIYAITRELPVSKARVTALVEAAAKHNPSAFDMQSARCVLLFGQQHDRLWEIVMEELRPLVKETQWEAAKRKVGGFAAGGGTILFFDDMETVEKTAASYPLYAEKFPGFALQSNGMLQFTVWSLLEAEGLGASLQHYNPLIDAKVKAQWRLPDSWELIAQMPFGGVKAPPGPKKYRDPGELVSVYA